MLKGLCHVCFLHFLYYANYALPWSHRFFLKFSASRKREQTGKRRQLVAIIIVSFKQFQVKQTQISWKASKSGRTQACNTREWDLNLTPVSLLTAVVTMTITLVFTCAVSCELGCENLTNKICRLQVFQSPTLKWRIWMIYSKFCESFFTSGGPAVVISNLLFPLLIMKQYWPCLLFSGC